VEQLRELGRALRQADRVRATAAATAAGLITAQDSASQAQGLMDLLILIGQPLQAQGLYDFGASTLVNQAFVQGRTQAMGEGFGSAPPADLLFLQRKFAGTFMLCARLGARLDMQAVFGDAL
jgi:aarF domain-containing kinase